LSPSMKQIDEGAATMSSNPCLNVDMTNSYGVRLRSEWLLGAAMKKPQAWILN